MPRNSEFAINKIPFVVDVPKIFSKYLSCKMSEFIKVISSKTLYKLLSIELNKVSKIEFIAFTIISVMLDCSKRTSFQINIILQC